MKNIKEIDRDNNGYATNQELDDIFKMHYDNELKKKDIKTLFKPFASLQNRILIDYKKLRDHILVKLKEREQSKPSMPGRAINEDYADVILKKSKTNKNSACKEFRESKELFLNTSTRVDNAYQSERSVF